MLPRTRRPGGAGSLRLGPTRPGSSRTWRTMAHPPRSLLLTPPLVSRPSLLCISIRPEEEATHHSNAVLFTNRWRTSENSVLAKFAFWAFSEVRRHGVLRSRDAG